MGRSRTFRPRLSREERDRVEQLASELNGAEITGGFPSALQLLLDWFAVIRDDVEECPDCGGSDLPDWYYTSSGDPVDLPPGKWYCEDCEDVFTVWDVLDVDNPENADFPISGERIRYRFEQ